MPDLCKKVADVIPDDLIAGTYPAVSAKIGTLAALTAATTISRGTILAKSTTSGKLYVLGSTVENQTLMPDCILCDDIEAGTSDIAVTIYVSGCFNLNSVIVKSGYTITENDKDELRKRNIIFSKTF